jgi:hypothetical protein
MLFSLAFSSYVVVPRDEETMPSFHATTMPESCGVFLILIVGLVAFVFSVDVKLKVVAGRIEVMVGNGGFLDGRGRAPLGLAQFPIPQWRGVPCNMP